MGKRCSLCGGKLRKGICTECGMDNRKSDERYLYHADKNVSPENVQPVENTTAEKKTKRKKQIYKKIKIIIVMIVEIILFLTCSFFKIKSIQGLNKIAVK